MQKLVGAAALFVLLAGGTVPSAYAQIAAPNAAGVAMGHLHYVVRDVEANTAFWMTLGGEAERVGDTVVITFPDVLVMLEEGESSGGTEGSILNHMAFRVRSLADVAAAGLEFEDRGSGVTNVFSPEDERIELFDDTSVNLNFTRDDGAADPVARRHLERFCRGLESKGVTFDVPYRRSESGIGYAFLTDPWGVTIALTEGLRGL